MREVRRLQVPAFDLARQVQTLKTELMECVERVLISGRLILGPELERFEKEIATYLQAKYAVGVASGTDALWLALKAAEVGPGDRVLTSPFTFFATASAILNTGAQPVFADIHPGTFNIEPEKVRDVLEARWPVDQKLEIDLATIKAIIPVHLFGQAADMTALLGVANGRGLTVIEDAAQALGSEQNGVKVGTLGDFGCFSFFPTKNLGGFGDGGLVVTNDKRLVERVRRLRVHGASRKYVHQLIGTNSRLDTLQAALLRLRLQHLESWTLARERHAALYDELLSAVSWLRTPYRSQQGRHVYNQYTVRVRQGKRDALQNFLRERDVETTVYYPVPMHLQPALEHLGYREGSFPEAERASQEVLSLPMFPELRPEEIEWVVTSIKAFGDTWNR